MGTKISFEIYLSQCKLWFMANELMDEATAEAHVEGGKESFLFNYEEDMSVEEACREDMGHWETD